MGWTYFEKPVNVKKWFEDNLTWENEKKVNKCIESSIKLHEGYAAVETIVKETGERYVWAAVFLFNYTREESYNFGYKDMDESMGPCYYNCPKKILDLLTPTTYEHAIEWRKKCLDIHAKTKKITIGTRISFENPISFQSFSDTDFIKTKYGRYRNVFKSVKTGEIVRLRQDSLRNATIRENANA